MEAILLGLIGSQGRMGASLREYLSGCDDISLHATLDLGEPLDGFLATHPQVVLDLSLGTAVDKHGPAVAEAGLPYIIGATGYAPATLERLAQISAGTGAPVLVVPNFSLGANLMLRCAQLTAGLMDYPVITERHHDGKADAPSGTARFTAELIAATQAQSGRQPESSLDPRFHSHPIGALGAAVKGVAVHSLRGSGYLAEQEVRFCLPGESLTIEHRSIDRRCFMPGIVFAIRHISRVQGLQVGLHNILGGSQ